MAKAIYVWNRKYRSFGRLCQRTALTALFLFFGIASTEAQSTPCSPGAHQVGAVLGAPLMIGKPCVTNPHSLEKDLRTGATLARYLDTHNKLIVDPQVLDYLNRLDHALVDASQIPTPYPITVKVIESGRISAFVLPGGQVYLSSGLILSMINESELAGILAHEIAHIAKEHDRRLQKLQNRWNIAAHCSGPLGFAVHFTGFLISMKATRNAEREADLIGIRYELAAGYSPEAFVQFLEMPQLQNDESHNLIAGLFATHPAIGERIRLAEWEISTLSRTGTLLTINPQQFEQMKTHLDNLIDSPNAPPTPQDRPALPKN